MVEKYIYKGKTISAYCKEHNINTSTIYRRIYSGKTLKEAFTEPIRPGHKPKKVHNSLNIFGMSASEFSRSIGKSPYYFYQRYRQLTKTNKICLRPDLTIQQLAKELKEGRVYTPDISDYFIKTYCIKRGYEYEKMYSRYSRLYAGSGMTFKEYIKQWEKDNGKEE